MTATIIDGAKALELIDQAIAHRGEDFTYPKGRGVCYYHTSTLFDHGRGCDQDGNLMYQDEDALFTLYEKGDKGACVVGYILLDLLGIDPALVEEDQCASDLIADLGGRNCGYIFTDEARGALNAAQATQDGGKPWREARTQASYLVPVQEGD